VQQLGDIGNGQQIEIVESIHRALPENMRIET